MKAIVLSCDKYRTVTNHMIHCYQNLWPNHPFVFRVPFQTLNPSQIHSSVEYIPCPPDIKGTVLTLLADLDDEEMVYWCIDDKYPIKLDVKNINNFHRSLVTNKNHHSIDGLLFCRCRGMLNIENIIQDKLSFGDLNNLLERKNYEQIWIHQFLKVKVIRHLFKSFNQRINIAKDMDVMKSIINLPESHRLYVTEQNFATFGESSTRGLLTKNCYESMLHNRLDTPTWASRTTNREIIMG